MDAVVGLGIAIGTRLGQFAEDHGPSMAGGLGGPAGDRGGAASGGTPGDFCTCSITHRGDILRENARTCNEKSKSRVVRYQYIRRLKGICCKFSDWDAHSSFGAKC